MLPDEEQQVLKTMKLRQAQHQHKNKKINTNTISTKPRLAVDWEAVFPTDASCKNIASVSVDVWDGFLEAVKQNETESRYNFIVWLVNDIKIKTSLLDAEPWNEILKDELETALSKLDKATRCLSETLMTWKGIWGKPSEPLAGAQR